MSEPTFHLSASPHVFQGDTTARVMWGVVAALVPATAWGIWAFGPRAGAVVLAAVAACVAAEAGALWLRGRPVLAVADGSAALTGLLLALNLPATSPWWLVVLGALAAIGLGKQVFGGLGQNPFNPALVARVLLLVSFPVHMTTWLAPGGFLADAVTSATPLGAAKTALTTAGSVTQVAAGLDFWRLAAGFQGGCIGEISAVALLLGAAFLLWRGTITWDIPASFLGCTLAVTGAAWALAPDRYLNPGIQLVTGGLVLGAFFMATDMVTSPLNARGRWIFGAGCGVLTGVIRLWGGYPEGVSFSILLMNACVPLIDRATKPKKFGLVPQGGRP